MKYQIRPERGFSDFFHCNNYNNVSFLSHVHSHIEFVFVLKGSIDITVENQKHILKSGDVAIIMPYEIHEEISGEDVDIFIIACPPEYISEYRQILRGKAFKPNFTKFEQSHREIIFDIIKSNFEDNLLKKALLYATVSLFVNKCESFEKSAFEYDVYRKAISYISENYMEDITLEKTAFNIGVTVSHLSRVLNSDGKPGFSEIVNSLRVFAAKQLLEQNNIPASEVAFKTGFGSIRNFNRVFKKTFGYNPSDIRKPNIHKSTAK